MHERGYACFELTQATNPMLAPNWAGAARRSKGSRRNPQKSFSSLIGILIDPVKIRAERCQCLEPLPCHHLDQTEHVFRSQPLTVNCPQVSEANRVFLFRMIDISAKVKQPKQVVCVRGLQWSGVLCKRHSHDVWALWLWARLDASIRSFPCVVL